MRATILSTLIALAVCPAINAQPSPPNGCGSGVSLWLVPNSIPLLQCNFQSACNAHDTCYGQCEGQAPDLGAVECAYLACRPGGTLAGSKRCRTDMAIVSSGVRAKQRRAKCDKLFGQQIIATNPGKTSCAAFAQLYSRAVHYLGESNFRGVKTVGAASSQSRAEYDAAIRRLFIEGTDLQFEALLESLKGAEASQLDLSRAIEYNAKQGLANKQ